MESVLKGDGSEQSDTSAVDKLGCLAPIPLSEVFKQSEHIVEERPFFEVLNKN